MTILFAISYNYKMWSPWATKDVPVWFVFENPTSIGYYNAIHKQGPFGVIGP